MVNFLFGISLLAAVTLLAISLFSLREKRLQFWPPPGRDTWQYRIFWLLFRMMIFGIAALCLLDFGSLSGSAAWRLAAGLPLTILGFGGAIFATVYLGWKNAHGEEKGLITDGWYRWSRNPIYVITLAGILGLGLLVNSARVWLLLIFWIFFYLVAPFLEEPWLEARYGDEYLAYKRRVPRFLGFDII